MRMLCLLLTVVVVMSTLLGLTKAQVAECVDVTIYHSAPCVAWIDAVGADAAAYQSTYKQGGTYTDPYANLNPQADDYNSPMCRCFRYVIITCDPPMSQFDTDLSKCLTNAV
eukprot:RCo031609